MCREKNLLRGNASLVYINLHVKYGSNLVRIFWALLSSNKKYEKKYFFSGSCWAVHKIQGTGCTKMSANADLITVETLCTIENQFFIYHVYGPKCIYFLFLAICGALGGGGGAAVFNDQTGAYLAFQLSFHPYLCTCEIRKQSHKDFLSSNPKYKKITTSFSYIQATMRKHVHFWLIGGGGGGAWVAHG